MKERKSERAKERGNYRRRRNGALRALRALLAFASGKKKHTSAHEHASVVPISGGRVPVVVHLMADLVMKYEWRDARQQRRQQRRQQQRWQRQKKERHHSRPRRPYLTAGSVKKRREAAEHVVHCGGGGHGPDCSALHHRGGGGGGGGNGGGD